MRVRIRLAEVFQNFPHCRNRTNQSPWIKVKTSAELHSEPGGGPSKRKPSWVMREKWTGGRRTRSRRMKQASTRYDENVARKTKQIFEREVSQKNRLAITRACIRPITRWSYFFDNYLPWALTWFPTSKLFSLFKALPKFKSRIGPRYNSHTTITRSEQFVWSLQLLYRFRKVVYNFSETVVFFQSYMC